MLRVEDLYFTYQNQQSYTLESLSFRLERGRNLAIIGESGCGKSTLLKLIYGLLDADKGRIFWNDELITGPKFNLIPGMPNMKYLAQDFDLMPYISVAENIGKYLSNFFPEKKKNRIDELLQVVEMTAFANVKAKYLSGGQMQRVALAKVLAKDPELLLLDEPFSHIDNFRKNSLRRNIFNYLKTHNITCIIATHDVNDSLSFTDEILVMKEGKLVDAGKTLNIYYKKPTKYVASLFDDVSEIEINSEKKLFYPYEFEIVEKSAINVKVIKSFFKGNHFLIEGIFNENLLYFISNYAIEKDAMVYVKEKSRN